MLKLLADIMIKVLTALHINIQRISLLDRNAIISIMTLINS